MCFQKNVPTELTDMALFTHSTDDHSTEEQSDSTLDWDIRDQEQAKLNDGTTSSPTHALESHNKLLDRQIQMLRNHATQLEHANQALTDSLASKEQILEAKNCRIKRMRHKYESKQAQVGRMEKIHQSFVHRNSDKHQALTKLEKKFKKIHDEHEKFKHDAAELIVAATKQLEAQVLTRNPMIRAHGMVKYNEGYLDGGGFLGQHVQQDAEDDITDARANERQASRALNDRILELFDFFGIDIVPTP
ncbi:hypothetical protein TruAng_007459 [Truncatella angustata]|nr:hypothetical protein TruAng_007459 [Truncatella angustata]